MNRRGFLTGILLAPLVKPLMAVWPVKRYTTTCILGSGRYLWRAGESILSEDQIKSRWLSDRQEAFDFYKCMTGGDA